MRIDPDMVGDLGANRPFAAPSCASVQLHYTGHSLRPRNFPSRYYERHFSVKMDSQGVIGRVTHRVLGLCLPRDETLVLDETRTRQMADAAFDMVRSNHDPIGLKPRPEYVLSTTLPSQG